MRRVLLLAIVLPIVAHASSAAPERHTRPRALAVDVEAGLLYVALSTTDEIGIVDVSVAVPKVVGRRKVCRFPEAIVARPGGGALVACRFDPGLRLIEREGGSWRVRTLDAGPESGARGLAVHGNGEAEPSGVAYVSSPATGGVKVVSLAGAGVVQAIDTGISPRALRVVSSGQRPGGGVPLLLVSNFIDHTVTVHPIGADGRLGDAIQTIRTDAPVLDMQVVGDRGRGELLLLTHEDRPLTRANGPVEGLDSVVLRLALRPGTQPFADPGPGRRRVINLGERKTPVIELAAVASGNGKLAIVGAGSDNVLVADSADALITAAAISVGANPTAVAALPGAGFVTADRLSDSLTFVGGGEGAGTKTSVLGIGSSERPTAAERGELLFFSRALVPHNVADGPLSLYTCAACHDDGHVDGRRHPAKRNRFFSMTKSCRGLGTTAPYLSLGDPATIDAFADNIVATHAQGAERDAAGFDKYPVELRVGTERVVLSPVEVRAALAAYMAAIPAEPSPFVPPTRRKLDARERRGLAVFRDGCAGCHQLVGDSARGDRIARDRLEARLLTGRVALTSPRRYAVGTPILGDGGNNPPSLRGVWDAAPYFSDGSARTLEDVLRRTDPNAPTVHAPENKTRPPAFTTDERAALLAFLKAL